MAATPNRPQLVGVDANVLFDLADGQLNSLSLLRAFFAFLTVVVAICAVNSGHMKSP